MTASGISGTEQVELASGQRLHLPLRYHDWSMFMAHFPVSAKQMQDLLPGPRLRPALLLPGVALLTIAGVRYFRTSELAPYDEVIIGTLVLYEPKVNVPAVPLLLRERQKGFGFFALHVPVTSEESRDAGIEVWGYPKFIAEIDFEESESKRRCWLRAAGEEILSFEVLRVRRKARPYVFANFTVKDGELLKAPIRAEGRIGIATLRGGARLTLGDHPIADELRSLRLRPWAIERIDAAGLHSVLPKAAERLPL
jgi:hypothetical protein